MAFPTTGNTNELHAVNQILASVGQAPVTTLDQTNPDVAICYMTLIDVSRQVQAEGWTFNKEFDYPMFLNLDSQLEIPNNMLQVDLAKCKQATYGSYDSVIRTNKESGKQLLYERNNHTFVWDHNPLYLDVVWLWDWQDLPIPIQEYIVGKASVIVSQRIVSDPNLYSMLKEHEVYLKAQALEYEANQGDFTYFGHPQGHDYYRSYQPFNALYR